ncbi:MAG: DUF4105 domain-containing protein [Treponema sp.]|jgi:hypothetical protein|nr:DUF4105 domain-containing protein [Treponema sp.]
MNMKLPLLVLLLLPAFSLFGLTAGEEAGDSDRGRYLTVKVAVVGPGDEIYLWWGHIGIIIEDALSGENRFYDWGVFSFENRNFFLDFAFGRLLYACTVSPAEYNIGRAVRANRDITVYTLDLSDQKKGELLRFAENNVLPENADYWYHHFNDNCATRVRDIIDRATSGAFKARYGGAPGRFTLRGHVSRHTWFSPFWDWAVSFWMGRGIDRPITMWQEMFLPSEVGRNLAAFTWRGENGVNRRLVSEVTVVNTARNRPVPLRSPRRNYREIAAGLVIALVLGFASLRRERKAWRRVWGTGQSVLGLFFGVTGFLLFFLEFFTNHDYTWHNANILCVNPLLLIAVPCGLIAALTKNEARRRRAETILGIMWTVVFAGGLAAFALNLFPSLYQENLTNLMLVLPAALASSRLPRNLKARGVPAA